MQEELESVNQIRTDNTMARRKRTKIQRSTKQYT